MYTKFKDTWLFGKPDILVEVFAILYVSRRQILKIWSFWLDEKIDVIFYPKMHSSIFAKICSLEIPKSFQFHNLNHIYSCGAVTFFLLTLVLT